MEVKSSDSGTPSNSKASKKKTRYTILPKALREWGPNPAAKVRNRSIAALFLTSLGLWLSGDIGQALRDTNKDALRHTHLEWKDSRLASNPQGADVFQSLTEIEQKDVIRLCKQLGISETFYSSGTINNQNLWTVLELLITEYERQEEEGEKHILRAAIILLLWGLFTSRPMYKKYNEQDKRKLKDLLMILPKNTSELKALMEAVTYADPQAKIDELNADLQNKLADLQTKKDNFVLLDIKNDEIIELIWTLPRKQTDNSINIENINFINDFDIKNLISGIQFIQNELAKDKNYKASQEEVKLTSEILEISVLIKEVSDLVVNLNSGSTWLLEKAKKVNAKFDQFKTKFTKFVADLELFCAKQKASFSTEIAQIDDTSRSIEAVNTKEVEKITLSKETLEAWDTDKDRIVDGLFESNYWDRKWRIDELKVNIQEKKTNLVNLSAGKTSNQLDLAEKSAKVKSLIKKFDIKTGDLAKSSEYKERLKELLAEEINNKPISGYWSVWIDWEFSLSNAMDAVNFSWLAEKVEAVNELSMAIAAIDTINKLNEEIDGLKGIDSKTWLDKLEEEIIQISDSEEELERLQKNQDAAEWFGWLMTIMKEAFKKTIDELHKNWKTNTMDDVLDTFIKHLKKDNEKFKVKYTIHDHKFGRWVAWMNTFINWKYPNIFMDVIVSNLIALWIAFGWYHSFRWMDNEIGSNPWFLWEGLSSILTAWDTLFDPKNIPLLIPVSLMMFWSHKFMEYIIQKYKERWENLFSNTKQPNILKDMPFWIWLWMIGFIFMILSDIWWSTATFASKTKKDKNQENLKLAQDDILEARTKLQRYMEDWVLEPTRKDAIETVYNEAGTGVDEITWNKVATLFDPKKSPDIYNTLTDGTYRLLPGFQIGQDEIPESERGLLDKIFTDYFSKRDSIFWIREVESAGNKSKLRSLWTWLTDIAIAKHIQEIKKSEEASERKAVDGYRALCIETIKSLESLWIKIRSFGGEEIVFSEMDREAFEGQAKKNEQAFWKYLEKIWESNPFISMLSPSGVVDVVKTIWSMNTILMIKTILRIFFMSLLPALILLGTKRSTKKKIKWKAQHDPEVEELREKAEKELKTLMSMLVGLLPKDNPDRILIEKIIYEYDAWMSASVAWIILSLPDREIIPQKEINAMPRTKKKQFKAQNKQNEARNEWDRRAILVDLKKIIADNKAAIDSEAWKFSNTATWKEELMSEWFVRMEGYNNDQLAVAVCDLCGKSPTFKNELIQRYYKVHRWEITLVDPLDPLAAPVQPSSTSAPANNNTWTGKPKSWLGKTKGRIGKRIEDLKDQFRID